MKREIVNRKHDMGEAPVNGDFASDPAGWLLARAKEHGLTTLLAHADDGVLWGLVKDKQLYLSSQYFPEVSPPLREKTLQECRLFGPEAELFVWRDGDGRWQARLVTDEANNGAEEETGSLSFDEYQVLWGTYVEDEQGGFSLVADGEIGRRHAPPVPSSRLVFNRERQPRPLRLQVRHYLSEDGGTGLLRVSLSRLVAVLADTEVK